MINKVFQLLKKPELYAKSTSKFWDDEHISKGMLEAHLHPTWEAASRKHEFIDKSVEWISTIAPSKEYNDLLDLGCGPGLYAKRLYNKGYNVTGIDFSKRSIEYATRQAQDMGQDIGYIYQNYIEVDYHNQFDIIIMIYCDYGALSDTDREVLLKKVYSALKTGGKFIFDVFTHNQYDGKKESYTWDLNEGSGFWKSDTHLTLESHYIYDRNIRLDQYLIIDKDENFDVVRSWDHPFTRDTIIDEVKKAGFEKIEIFSDVAGCPYEDKSKTLCIVVEK